MKINGQTRLCILVGDPVAHSVSPQIHNAAFLKLGLNYVYAACAVKNLREAVLGIRGLGIRGASVTFPHKQNIIPFLDRLDPLAGKIGAVNTVVNEAGRLIGYNTDGEAAFLSLTENGVRLEGKKVVMLGAGGAARAISFAIAGKKLVRELCLFDIVQDRAQTLAREVSRKTGAPVRSAKLDRQTLARSFLDADVLINTSPVGVHPEVNQSPIPKSLVRPGMVVFDIVYNPSQTLLLKHARARGCKTIPGIEMLVRQAGEQFRLWTGRNPPLEVMFRAGKKALLASRA